MKFDVISLLPDMFAALNHGVIGRAQEQSIITVQTHNPRDFTTDTHRTVDDRPYGGGPGMVMLFEPLNQTLQAVKQHNAGKVIYLSPQGKPLTQEAVKQFSQQPELILLCGRYEGIDQRLIEHAVDEEWSVGDYVVSGGELPAMLLIDAITRLLPGTLGHEQSAVQDSFTEGLLDCPHYTRPEQIQGMQVPEILRSGDHQAISRWRLKQSLGKTWQMRPDLIKSRILNELEKKLLDEFINEAEK